MVLSLPIIEDPRFRGLRKARVKQGQHRSGKVGRHGTVLGRSWGGVLGHPVPGL